MRRLVLIRSVSNLVLVQTLPPNLSDRSYLMGDCASTNVLKDGLQKLLQRELYPANNYFERSVFKIQLDKSLCVSTDQTKSLQ